MENIVAGACASAPAAIPFKGTGVTSAGAIAADGTLDIHYKLVSYPGPYGGGSTTDAFAFFKWDLGTGVSSKFIGPNGNGDLVAEGRYVYRQRIDLSCYSLPTVSVSGHVVADDNVRLYVNGKSIFGPAGAYNVAYPFSLAGASFTQYLVQGVNEFDFVIENTSFSRSGLRVQIDSATGTVAPTNPSLAMSLAYSGGNRIGGDAAIVTAPEAVNWTVDGAYSGSLSANSGLSTTYTEQAVVSSFTVVPLKATSMVNPAKSAYSTLYFNPGGTAPVDNAAPGTISFSPDQAYLPGGTFTANVTMTNSGTTTWTTGAYKLVPQGSLDWGQSSGISLPTSSSISNGQSVTFSFTATAPATACNPCAFDWKMQRVSTSATFGTASSTTRIVSNPTTDGAAPEGSISFSPDQAYVPGASFTAQLVMKNTGTTTWTTGAYKLIPQGSLNWGLPNGLDLPPGSTVAPNGMVSFTINATAPATACSPCLFEWKMQRVSTATVFGSAASTNRVVSTPIPANQAVYVSGTVPLAWNEGTLFSSTITMQNTGTATWTSAAGYSLQSQNPIGTTRWGNSSIALPSSIAPGSNASFSWQARAPIGTGSQAFSWQMSQSGTPFGGNSPQYVSILSAIPQLTLSVESAPAAVQTGQSFSASLRVTNTGTTAVWGYGVNPTRAIRIRSANPADNTTWGMARVDLTGYLDPGASVVIPVLFTAPQSDGVKAFSWQLFQEGGSAIGGIATQNITVNTPLPSVNSLNPSSGSFQEQLFSIRYTGGMAPLDSGHMEIAATRATSPRCIFYYTNNTIYLHSGTNQASPVSGSPGSVGVVLQNEQCYIRLGETSITPDGNGATINFKVGFMPSFAGPKLIHARAWSQAGLSTDWVQLGSITAAPPVSVTVSPQGGTVVSGQTRAHSATVTGSSNTDVGWTAQSGSINSGGLFTAAVVPNSQPGWATATSQANSSFFDTSHFTVTPTAQPALVTSISPSGTINGSTKTFTITATGGTAPVYSVTFYANVTQLNDGGCNVTWFPGTNVVSVTQNGSSPYPVVGTIGSGNLGHFNCSVNLYSSYVNSVSGNNATVTLAISRNSNGSAWNYYGKASNTSGQSSPDWAYFGYWIY